MSMVKKLHKKLDRNETGNAIYDEALVVPVNMADLVPVIHDNSSGVECWTDKGRLGLKLDVELVPDNLKPYKFYLRFTNQTQHSAFVGKTVYINYITNGDVIEASDMNDVIDELENVHAKFYTKDNLKNTGESQVNWDNITNLPPTLGENVPHTSLIHFNDDPNYLHITQEESDKFHRAYQPNEEGKVRLVDLDTDVTTQAEFDKHLANYINHVTAEDRNKWDAKYDRPALGIPYSHLAKLVQDMLDNGQQAFDDFNIHKVDAVKHITAEERVDWNRKYFKPLTGIPLIDLNETVRNMIEHKAGYEVSYNMLNLDLKGAIDKAKNSAQLVEGKLPITELDTDIATQEELNTHSSNTDIHIVADEREAWNSKYDKPELGIPEADLTIALIDRLYHKNGQEIKYLELDTNLQSAVDKANNSAQLVNGKLPISELDTDIATQEELNTHVLNTEIHITGAERIAWDDKYDKPETGIPLNHLDAIVVDRLLHQNGFEISDGELNLALQSAIALARNSAQLVEGKLPLESLSEDVATQEELDAHTTDTDIHITALERIAWNSKYDKPITGIPELDLEAVLVDRIYHRKGYEIKYSELDSLLQGSVDKADNSAQLVEGKLPITSLDTDVATQNELDTHSSDLEVHITAEERIAWNNKYDKPINGIPETDLALAVQNKLNYIGSNGIEYANLNTDLKDRVSHQGVYDVKYAELSPDLKLAIDKANKAVILNPDGSLDSDLLDKGFVLQSEFNIHATNQDVHVTPSKQYHWNNKYNKPVMGIPLTDFDASVQDFLNRGDMAFSNLETHSNDMGIHVTQADRTRWDRKYALPSTGVPYGDLSSDVMARINNTGSYLLGYAQIDSELRSAITKAKISVSDEFVEANYQKIIDVEEIDITADGQVDITLTKHLISFDKSAITVGFNTGILSTSDYTIMSSNKIQLNSDYSDYIEAGDWVTIYYLKTLA